MLSVYLSENQRVKNNCQMNVVFGTRLNTILECMLSGTRKKRLIRENLMIKRGRFNRNMRKLHVPGVLKNIQMITTDLSHMKLRRNWTKTVGTLFVNCPLIALVSPS